MIRVQDVFPACVLDYQRRRRPVAPLQLQHGEFVSAANAGSMQLSVTHGEGFGAVIPN
jgi:hypothetical protein